MQYGRTALEVIAAQALILIVCLVMPVDVIATFGYVFGGLLATVVAAAIGTVLYVRHRNRVAIADLTRKLEVLRQAPVA
jgi:hypothetical protein